MINSIRVSKINHPEMLKQIIDFTGLEYGDNLFPSDIDGIYDCKGKGYIIIEVKRKGVNMLYGQRLLLERLVNDLSASNKKIILIVINHDIADVRESIFAVDCMVREVYTSDKKCWELPNTDVGLKKCMDKFLHSLGLI